MESAYNRPGVRLKSIINLLFFAATMLVVCLIVNHASILGSSIRITSPQDGANVVAGQVIQVIIQPGAGTLLQKASAWIIPVSSTPQIAISSPFQVQVSIPYDQIGPATLEAVAVDQAGTSVATSITILIGPPGPPQAVDVQPQEILFLSAGESRHISVTAVFSDGVDRNVTRALDTRYSSTNSLVGGVSTDGFVTALSPGVCTINVNHAGFSKAVSVKVGAFGRPGDLDGDSDVDQDDLDILRSALNTNASGPSDPRDLNNDGIIDSQDVQILRSLCSRLACATEDKPPSITCPANISIANDRGSCSAIVSPGFATAIDDIDGRIAAVGVRSDGSPLHAPYTVGTTFITWTATDHVGNRAFCREIILVNETEPPAIIEPAANPHVLWPPNRRMVDVTISYHVTDNCIVSSTIDCALSVTSNEGTSADWQIVDAHHVRLRAERAGNGNGRVYTITITCTDTTGNRSSQTVTVRVPHDQSQS